MQNHKADMADRLKKEVIAPMAEGTARGSERLARGSEELASVTRRLADRTRHWADDVTGARRRRMVGLASIMAVLAALAGYVLMSKETRG